MTSITFPVLLLAACAPVAVRFTLHTVGVDSAPGAAWVVHCERGIALVFLVFIAWEARRLWRGTDTSVSPSGDMSWSRSVRLLLLVVPLLTYFAWFYRQAFVGLYLGDHDFTNISAALNQTARGAGLLPSPYVHGGPGDTFLGHHFAPALFLFVPFYTMAGALDQIGVHLSHGLYAGLLYLVFAIGVLLWARVFQRELPEPFASSAVLVLVLAFPFWRIGASFHFEVLVVPASALLVGALPGRAGRWRFWAGALLLLAVKEDMAAYVLCIALVFASRSESRGRGIALMIVCVVYGALALTALGTLAPEQDLPWGAYWRDIWDTERAFAPGIMLVAAVGCLPLAAGRSFLLALFPVLVLHALSFHPWHQGLTGHYGYASLPALLLVMLEGLRRLSSVRAGRLLLFVALAIVSLRAAVDRDTPVSPLAAHPDYPALAELVAGIPSGACVQSSFSASPHLGLRHRALPLLAPESHPGRLRHAPYLDPVHFTPGCGRRFLLIRTGAPRPPHYIEEHLRALSEYGGRFGEPVVVGPWELFALSQGEL